METHKKEYETLQDNINNTTICRHEMKHHLNAVNTLLSNNDTAEALNYVRRLETLLGQKNRP